MRIKTIIAALAVTLALSAPVCAQTGSSKTVTALNNEVNSLFPDQNTGAITPFDARQTFLDIIASSANLNGTVFLGNTAFINTYLPGFLDPGVANITAAAPQANISMLLAAQSSQKTLADGYLGQIPLTILNVVDTTVATYGGIFGAYVQNTLLATSDPVVVGGGRTYGAILAEFSTSNLWAVVGSDPYTINANGSVHGLRVDCGLGPSGPNNCGGYAFEVVNNGAQFGGGLLCGSNALIVTAGVSYCIAAVNDQFLAWFYGAGNVGFSITSEVTASADAQVLKAVNTGLNYYFDGSLSVSLQSSGVINLASGGNVQIASNFILGMSEICTYGSISGSVCQAVGATVGGNYVLRWPGGSTDFTGTGGTSQVVKQTTSGGAFTVAQLACADLSNAAASCATDATNAANIGSGTLPSGRLSGAYTGITELAAAVGIGTAATAATGLTINGPGTDGTTFPFILRNSGSVNLFYVDDAGDIFTTGAKQGVTTVCTETVGNTLTFTNGLLTTKGANCT
jgi:hypothetical protein